MVQPTAPTADVWPYGHGRHAMPFAPLLLFRFFRIFNASEIVVDESINGGVAL